MTDWLERVLLSLEDDQLLVLQQLVTAIKESLSDGGLRIAAAVL